MAIIPHNFNGKAIEQTFSETVINGVKIPKGYVNLSQMCKVNPKKRIKDYLKNDNSLDYLIALSETLTTVTYTPPGGGILPPDNHAGSSPALLFGLKSGLLIKTYDAIGGDSDLYCQIEIAIHAAQWISPQFAVWANRTLRLVISGEFKALTDEAKQAQKALQKIWEEIRSGSVVTRRTLTDAIKAYLETHEVSENYRKFVYSNCSDKINRSLFGKTAAQLCAERSCSKDELRDTHSAASLVSIERIEYIAVKKIDRGIEPQIATNEAIEVCS